MRETLYRILGKICAGLLSSVMSLGQTLYALFDSTDGDISEDKECISTSENAENPYFSNLAPSSGPAFLDQEKKAFLETVVTEHLTVMDRSEVTLDDKLSQGSQGIIYAGTLQVTTQATSFSNPVIVCIAVKKFIRRHGIAHGQIPRGLWATSCIHVCKPLGVIFHKDSDCMVMPRYSRDLRTEIDSRMNLTDLLTGIPVDRPFTEVVAVHIILQLALGLKGLHDCGIYHRDVKAANVLVNPYRNSEFYEVAIADFEGASDAVGGGTQYWRAPEVLDSKITRKPLAGQQWQAADVYSFGMTCYEVLTGKIPLGNLKHADYHLVLEGYERPLLPNHVPKRLKEIIRRCWLHDPASRPSLADVLVCLEEVDNHRLANTGLGIPRSFMKLPKSHPELPESPRPTLSHILSTPQPHELDPERRTNFSFWASEYGSTQEQFVPQFDMKARLQDTSNAHDSLTFAEFVERRRALAFIRLQKDGSGHNIEATKDEYSRSGPIRVEARMCGPKLLLPSEGFRRYSSSPPLGSNR